MLPRLRLGLELFPDQGPLVAVAALLDTGADHSALDGSLVLTAGGTMDDVIARAIDVKPIRGVAGSGSITAYEHHVTGYLAFGGSYAELRLRVLITPPGSLRSAILGRRDFFEQVDITFAEFEKMLYLRFRNPALQSLFD